MFVRSQPYRPAFFQKLYFWFEENGPAVYGVRDKRRASWRTIERQFGVFRLLELAELASSHGKRWRGDLFIE